MSDENKGFTSTAFSFSSGGLSEAQLQDMVSNVKDNDMKILAQLLVEIKHENDEANKHAKKQSIFALATSVLCLIFVIAILVVVCKFVPVIENVAADASKLIADTNEVVLQANEIIGEATEIIGEATGIIGQVEEAIDQVVGMIDQTNGMLDQTASMLDDTAVVIKNVEGITTDLSQTDYQSMLDDINGLVTTSEAGIQDAVSKINDVDLNSLNDAISDLSSIIAPLARLFKR